jgi:hypothetical protein
MNKKCTSEEDGGSLDTNVLGGFLVHEEMSNEDTLVLFND